MPKNVSLSHYLKSHLNYPRYYWRVFTEYNSNVRNPITTLNKVRQSKFPLKMELKDGSVLTVNSHFETSAVSRGYGNCFTINDGVVTITKEGLPEIRLYGVAENGDVVTVFFEEEYEFLNMKDCVVIDVGANIGDSSIYFALRGAKSVIALEPVIANFMIAEKNVSENNLGGKIKLLHAGCSGRKGTITISKNAAGPCSELCNVAQGDDVKLTTLEEIVKDIDKNENMILKMDCEGCEYESVLKCPDKILKRFQKMVIEYHYGYQDLRTKLEECGFETSVTEPHHVYNSDLKNPNMFMGNMYAVRR